ncbi:hypothetical protein B0T26DRAFT_31603 [Lasiosphaeria miniovina]|uniref:Uncharacterized protein n=1 Tax=Lasiosphaeria miniovina TaxID=1954250 RepID=A0AA40ECW3_9PEZI|nr:uncharacterized protein B0T26DRAFT_31603 [Lasiosphaeria miniovina]KAK0733672.1 hypothetical protein B0T26DRAFT_31603 [Lasiosphaeria miniovina]
MNFLFIGSVVGSLAQGESARKRSLVGLFAIAIAHSCPRTGPVMQNMLDGHNSGRRPTQHPDLLAGHDMKWHAASMMSVSSISTRVGRPVHRQSSMGGRGEGHLFERARFQGPRRAGGLEWAVAWLTMAGDDGKGKCRGKMLGARASSDRARPHPMRSDACCTVRIPAHWQPGSLALGRVYSFSHSPVEASPRALPDSGRTWERCSHHVCRATDQFEDFTGILCSAWRASKFALVRITAACIHFASVGLALRAWLSLLVRLDGHLKYVYTVTPQGGDQPLARDHQPWRR